MLCSVDTVILNSDGCIWQLFKILVSHGAKFTSPNLSYNKAKLVIFCTVTLAWFKPHIPLVFLMLRG